MHHLPNLFKLIQLARTQVQYGFLVSGFYKHELPDLAQHQYMVTFISWQIALSANKSGCKLDVQKVMEYSLVHDLGEIFGSDISRPYALANPPARMLAKKFEALNLKFISEFFGEDKQYFQKLSKEILEPKNDEAVVAKLADYLEVIHFMIYLKKIKPFDFKIIKTYISNLTKTAKDPVLKKYINKFSQTWFKTVSSTDYLNQAISEIINEQ